MKLIYDHTLSLIFLMFWPMLAHPAPTPRGKESLQKLYQDMRRLLKMVTQEGPVNKSEMMQDFEYDLTSLPTLRFRPKDLESVEINSTLGQLFSGLKSFMYHLDWLQQKQKRLEIDYSKTTKIAHQIQVISQMVLRQIGNASSEDIYPTLPPLNTAWSMYQATVEIHKKFYFFCDYYTRALGALKQRR